MDLDDARLHPSPPLSESVSLVTPLNQHRGGANEDQIAILHVDDEPDFGSTVKAYLEQTNDDLVVMTEPDATAGLERIDEGEFDCVVSDFQMPETDGLEFLELVREREQDLPFILFTGKGSEEIASEAIARGVTDYLQKGTGTSQYEVLANRIRNAVDRYYTEQELWTTLSWYQRLVEQCLAGIYLLQGDEIVYANEEFANIFGYTQAELVGRSVRSLVAADDHEQLVENIRRREGGDVEDIRYTLTGIRKDGTRIDFEVHGGRVEFEGEPAVMGILLEKGEPSG